MSNWEHQGAEQSTLIVTGMRGLGDSEKTPATDIHEPVQHLGYSNIFLAEHDQGGCVAYVYAAAHWDAVRRLAVLEIIPPDDAILSELREE